MKLIYFSLNSTVSKKKKKKKKKKKNTGGSNVNKKKKKKKIVTNPTVTPQECVACTNSVKNFNFVPVRSVHTGRNKKNNIYSFRLERKSYLP